MISSAAFIMVYIDLDRFISSLWCCGLSLIFASSLHKTCFLHEFIKFPPLTNMEDATFLSVFWWFALNAHPDNFHSRKDYRKSVSSHLPSKQHSLRVICSPGCWGFYLTLRLGFRSFLTVVVRGRVAGTSVPPCPPRACPCLSASCLTLLQSLPPETSQ